jgi:two-component sensor histidine kinase
MELDDLYRVLRGAHAQAQGVVDTVRDPLLVLDGNLCVVSANHAFYDTFAVDRDETIGVPLYELGDGQWNIDELRLLLETVIPRAASVDDYEVAAEFPRIGRRTMLVSARRLAHPDRHSRALLLSIVDATERRQLEQENRVYVGELQHRVRNLLGLVSALARQTEAPDESARTFRDALLGRLNALALSLDASLAGKASRLDELAARTTEPFTGQPSAVAIEGGPDLVLNSAQALAVGMILHELATNAIKYGALSVPGGRVRLGWDMDEAGDGGALATLQWAESGGPATAPPTTRGFGMRLIEFAATRELHGEADLTFAPEGLSAEIRFPLGAGGSVEAMRARTG